MHTRITLILFLLLMAVHLYGQTQVEVMRFEEFEKNIQTTSDKLTIVNFWATWCEPCVTEIPDFVNFYNQYSDSLNLDIIFVSLDRHRDIDRVKTFVKQHNMPGRLILLDDIRRMNQWVPKIHSTWRGTLPATGFYQGGVLRDFHTRQLQKEELLPIIQRLKNSS